MPELAAAYTLGFVCCLALTLLYVFLRERRRHSASALVLQSNLRKLNLFWSDSADAIIPLQSDSVAQERRRSQTTIGYLGLVLSLLSWGGLFFMLIIMLSERFFARSRRERRLFGSRLAQDSTIPASEVRSLLRELDVLNESPAEAAHPI